MLCAVPWLTKLANGVIQGRLGDPTTQTALARDAVDNLERLGPTYVKLGQIMSIRCVLLRVLVQQGMLYE